MSMSEIFVVSFLLIWCAGVVSITTVQETTDYIQSSTSQIVTHNVITGSSLEINNTDSLANGQTSVTESSTLKNTTSSENLFSADEGSTSVSGEPDFLETTIEENIGTTEEETTEKMDSTVGATSTELLQSKNTLPVKTTRWQLTTISSIKTGLSSTNTAVISTSLSEEYTRVIFSSPSAAKPTALAKTEAASITSAYSGRTTDDVSVPQTYSTNTTLSLSSSTNENPTTIVVDPFETSSQVEDTTIGVVADDSTTREEVTMENSTTSANGNITQVNVNTITMGVTTLPEQTNEKVTGYDVTDSTDGGTTQMGTDADVSEYTKNTYITRSPQYSTIEETSPFDYRTVVDATDQTIEETTRTDSDTTSLSFTESSGVVSVTIENNVTRMTTTPSGSYATGASRTPAVNTTSKVGNTATSETSVTTFSVLSTSTVKSLSTSEYVNFNVTAPITVADNLTRTTSDELTSTVTTTTSDVTEAVNVTAQLYETTTMMNTQTSVDSTVSVTGTSVNEKPTGTDAPFTSISIFSTTTNTASASNSPSPSSSEATSPGDTTATDIKTMTYNSTVSPSPSRSTRIGRTTIMYVGCDVLQCNSISSTKCVKDEEMSYCSCRPGYYRPVSQQLCQKTLSFSLVLRITGCYNDTECVFTNDLQNPESAKYQEFERDFCEAISAVFSTIDGYLGCQVKGFQRGSVIVDYFTYFEESSSVTGTQIENVTKSNVADDGTLTGSQFTVDEKSISVEATNECNLRIDDCHEDALCIDEGANGFTCQCNDGYKDSQTDDPGRVCIKDEVNTALLVSLLIIAVLFIVIAGVFVWKSYCSANAKQESYDIGKAELTAGKGHLTSIYNPVYIIDEEDNDDTQSENSVPMIYPIESGEPKKSELSTFQSKPMADDGMKINEPSENENASQVRNRIVFIGEAELNTGNCVKSERNAAPAIVMANITIVTDDTSEPVERREPQKTTRTLPGSSNPISIYHADEEVPVGDSRMQQGACTLASFSQPNASTESGMKRILV